MKTLTYLLLASAFFIFDTDGKDRRGRQIENFSGGIGFTLLGITRLNVLASIQNGVPIESQPYQTKNNLSFTFQLTLKAFACKQAR